MAFPGLFNSLQDSGSCLDTLPQFDQMGSLVELLGKGQHNSVAVEKTVTTNMLEGSAGICGPESSQQAAETQHDDDTASFTEMGDAEAAQEHGEAGAGVEEQDQDEQPQGPVLTQTLHMGIQDMDASIANIEQKIRELTAVGLQRLDDIRSSFISEMDRFMHDLRQVRGLQYNRWCELARVTLEENERLMAAKTLVGRLGADSDMVNPGNAQ